MSWPAISPSKSEYWGWMMLQHRFCLRGSNKKQTLPYWESLDFNLQIPRWRVKIWLSLNRNKDYSIIWLKLSRSLHSSWHNKCPTKSFSFLVYAICLLLKASPTSGRPYCKNTHTKAKRPVLRSCLSKQTRQVKDEARKEKYRAVNWLAQNHTKEIIIRNCNDSPFLSDSPSRTANNVYDSLWNQWCSPHLRSLQ